MSGGSHAGVGMGDLANQSSNSDLFIVEETVNTLPQFANLPTKSDSDLHISITAQISGEINQTKQRMGYNESMPGGLPS